MWTYLVAGVAGALWANSRAPNLAVTKSKIIGSRSGHKWDVEFVEDLGAMVVIHSGTRVVFTKTDDGWKHDRSKGDPSVIALARKDFES